MTMFFRKLYSRKQAFSLLFYSDGFRTQSFTPMVFKLNLSSHEETFAFTYYSPKMQQKNGVKQKRIIIFALTTIFSPSTPKCITVEEL